jgi:hypothetical protein
MLHQLATDPIFNTLPPGATRISLTKTPAKYRKTPFQGEGWDGPSVVLHFTSSAPVLDVYRHYAQLAARAQWAPGGKGSLGVTMDWSIDYPNAHAQVVLFLDNQHDTALPRGYSLRGSIGSRAASSAPTTGHTG